MNVYNCFRADWICLVYCYMHSSALYGAQRWHCTSEACRCYVTPKTATQCMCVHFANLNVPYTIHKIHRVWKAVKYYACMDQNRRPTEQWYRGKERNESQLHCAMMFCCWLIERTLVYTQRQRPHTAPKNVASIYKYNAYRMHEKRTSNIAVGQFSLHSQCCSACRLIPFSACTLNAYICGN